MTLSRPSTRVSRWPISVALMSRHCSYCAQSADDRALGQSDFEGVVFVTFRCSQLRFSCGAKWVFVGAFAVDFGFNFVLAPWFVRKASKRNAHGFDLVRIIKRTAAAPRLTLVTLRKRRIIKVVAPRALQQIASDSCHVAQLRARSGEQRQAQNRITRLDQFVLSHIGVAGQRANAYAFVWKLLNLCKWQSIDVH